MSKKMKIDCHGDPVTIEVTDEGNVVFHDWDEEAECAIVELGFEPSQCYVLWNLIKNGNIDTSLIEHCRLGNLEIIEFLLFVGADVHAENDHPLWWASVNCNAEIVRLLLNAGANVHARNDAAIKRSSYFDDFEIVGIFRSWIRDHG